MLLTVIVFFLIISALILIHELGHFIVARALGIKVEEFGFGFPLTRAIFSIKKGETVYSFYPVLIGGFVKLYGEDEAGAGRVSLPKKMSSDIVGSKSFAMREEEIEITSSDSVIREERIEISEKIIINDKNKGKNTKLSRAFFARSPWQRAAVIVAGVVMNILLSAFIFYIFLFANNFKTDLPLINDHKFFLVDQKNTPAGIVINGVFSDSPAGKAQIKIPSKIIKLNGHDITPTTFVKEVNQKKGKRISLELIDQANNKKYNVYLTPRVSPPVNEGALGLKISVVSFAIAHLSYDTPLQKLFSGFIHPANLMAWNFDAFASIISTAVKHNNYTQVAEGVSGPIGIFSIVSVYTHIPDAKQAILQLLFLSGFLSAFLAFVNILPIPALDGGRLFFILIEAVSGKKINPQTEALLNNIFMIILLAVMAVITFKDVFFLISGQLPLAP